MNLKEIECDVVDLFQVLQDRTQWRVILNLVINIHVT